MAERIQPAEKNAGAAMAMLPYNAERELARMHLLLRRSYQDMKEAEEGNPITDLDLSSTEFA